MARVSAAGHGGAGLRHAGASSRKVRASSALGLTFALVGALAWMSSAFAPPAMGAPPAPPPPAPSTGVSPPPLTPSSAAAPVSAGTPPREPSAVAASPPAPPPADPERHVPMLDASAAESDHDAVRDTWGVQVRPVATKLSVFGLRAGTGCPAAATSGADAACPSVAVSALSVRRWVGRNLAWNAGLAFALGGGRDDGRLLDTYFGGGPVVGMSILLANWRHLAVAASPELTIVAFRGAGSASTAYLAALGAHIEAELHFGFIGVPALSLGLRSGLAFRLEHAARTTLWSIGVDGATTVRGLFQDLVLRYYF